MKPVFFYSGSPKQTMAFAKKFARSLRAGDVLALTGNLGSGKTTFVKGLALGLGIDDADKVKSPTFVLMHIYPTRRIPLYHFDLYRIEGRKDLESLGLEDYISNARGIVCIEWAAKAASFFPPSVMGIHLESAGKNKRKITLYGSRSMAAA